jgi:hypothetical protein
MLLTYGKVRALMEIRMHSTKPSASSSNQYPEA